MRSTAESSEWDEVVESYLIKEVQDGNQFFKSRHIAAEFDVTAKKVGTAIYQLSQTSTNLSIDTWGGTSDGTTWYVELD